MNNDYTFIVQFPYLSLNPAFVYFSPFLVFCFVLCLCYFLGFMLNFFINHICISFKFKYFTTNSSNCDVLLKLPLIQLTTANDRDEKFKKKPFFFILSDNLSQCRIIEINYTSRADG